MTVDTNRFAYENEKSLCLTWQASNADMDNY